MTLVRVAAIMLLVAAAPNVLASADPQLREALRAAVAETADQFEDRFAAEVWLIDMSTRMRPWQPNDVERMNILRSVYREALRADLRPELVLAVIQIESGFDRFAVSTAGAQGLMQVMPFWRNEIGRPDDNLQDIATNLRYGCTILRHYLDRSGGYLPGALQRYYGNPRGSSYAEKVLTARSRYWYDQ